MIVLWVAAVAATVGALLGWRFERIGRAAITAALALVWAAVGRVVVLLAAEDTSWEIIVDHTRPGLGALRRAMGLWGGSAGSLLLFTAIVATTVLVGGRWRRWWVAAAVATPLLWALVLVEPPFVRLDVPAIAGSGLSPILEHWAMLAHPPLLYLGLALALVPAISTPAASKRWTFGAVATLTVALALGGRWAWVELGWGGWWAWDPVENVALIPWLLLLVSVHLPTDARLTRVAAALVWPAVFAGTAMTRTSLRTSVHAFADAEGLGWFLWPLAAGSAVVLARAVGARAPSRRPSVGRRLAAIVAFVAAVVVAAGTFRPFVPGDATTGVFYARFLWPVALVAMIGVGVAPRRDGDRWVPLAVDSALGAAIMLGIGAASGWTWWWQLVWLVCLGIGAGALAGDAIRTRPRTRRSIARFGGHLGLLLVCAAIVGDTASTSTTFGLAAGESLEVDGRIVTNLDATIRSGSLEVPGPLVLGADIDVDGTVLSPTLTVYPERGLRLPELVSRPGPTEDVQLILRSIDDDGAAVVTLNVEPLASLVWLGAILIATSTALAASGRRTTT